MLIGGNNGQQRSSIGMQFKITERSLIATMCVRNGRRKMKAQKKAVTGGNRAVTLISCVHM